MLSPIALAAPLFLFCAVLHALFGPRFRDVFRGRKAHAVWHALCEVELGFVFWAALYLVFAAVQGETWAVLERTRFTEPLFVLAIMAIAGTRPVLDLAQWTVTKLARALPLPEGISFYGAALAVTPLLGSLLSEPAAMTIAASLLRDRYFSSPHFSEKARYASLGLLFVNISIGGALTPYAAPAVLMVAAPWGWDLAFTLRHFAWKAALAVVLAVIFTIWRFRHELTRPSPTEEEARRAPAMGFVHLVFLAAVVVTGHHVPQFGAIFLGFLVFAAATRAQSGKVSLREAMLVGLFLCALTVLTAHQDWWLATFLPKLAPPALFTSAAALTAFVDNAALTLLGVRVPDLTFSARYALVAGSLVGGGLTLIANAPNPIGYGLLRSSFPAARVQPLRLLWAALPPTLIAAACFWLP